MNETIDDATVVVNNLHIAKETISVGWLCPRCGVVNAPDVKRCECEPKAEDVRHGVLPHTIVGPSETK